MWPRTLNNLFGGRQDCIYLAVNWIPDGNPGFQFINGLMFLKRFYSVFDTGNRRIGLANTPFTLSDID
jgi:cathepsin E